MRLEEFGWDDFFAAGFAPHAREGSEAARVFLQHNRVYMLYTEAGETWAETAGRLRYHARGPEDLPAIGDWVVVRRQGAEGAEGKATIHEILPRRSKFSRRAAGSRGDEQVVAANVDTLFIVMGLDHDFNLRRLERYLIMAWESGAQPVVVLNKADLATEPEARRGDVGQIATDVPVILLSAREGDGIEQLASFHGPGKTIAFVGSSGVGKSTIVNRLLGEQTQRTQEVRAHDQRGQHTTTHRELFRLPAGGLIIDTPGMRELQLLVSERGLSGAFDDVEEIAGRCRFSDCRHADEPGCAVREALSAGSLDADRYASYQKLQAEMRALAVRQDQRAAQEEKANVRRATRAFNKSPKRR